MRCFAGTRALIKKKNKNAFSRLLGRDRETSGKRAFAAAAFLRNKYDDVHG
jgi:hypothetical protein